MTTASQAYSVIRTTLEAGTPITLHFQNEINELPDIPEPFAYVEFTADPASVVSFGGGRGANRYRNPASVTIYVFTPNGEGLSVALGHAETLAALLRSYRDANISCFDASVLPGGNGEELKPIGFRSEVGNYDYAIAEVSLFYDQIG